MLSTTIYRLANAVLPEGMTAEMIEAFCIFCNYEFVSIGEPDNWQDPDVFRVGTQTFPSIGYTVKFTKVFEWKEAMDLIGERIFEGGIYRHYQGDICTTIMRGEGNKMAFRDGENKIHFVDVGDFFTVTVDEDNKIVPRFAQVVDTDIDSEVPLKDGQTYSHVYTLAFTVNGSTSKTGEDVTSQQIQAAVQKRISDLIANDELLEAVGVADSTIIDNGVSQ
jgi:hypothetical protein